MVSDNLARKSTWKVITHNNIGSNHFPILCPIVIDIQKEKVERIQRWAFKKANWINLRRFVKIIWMFFLCNRGCR